MLGSAERPGSGTRATIVEKVCYREKERKREKKNK